ncbi:MAG: mechanosensitive ion channel family protein [Bacilli bacterium]|nr:mechanosensitive ion channel family protein [Bacilli bacterium]
MDEEKKRKLAKPLTWWQSRTKAQKITFIVLSVFSLFVLFVIALVLSARELGLADIADSMYGPGVSGWQWLLGKLGTFGTNILWTIAIVSIAVVVGFLLNLIIGLVTWKGKRSRTVGSVVKSIVKYVIAIFAAGFVLSVWGVDVTSIVAGIGIVTLIIGLGCQSLIEDIVSGLFLVFDDFFDVGDIVIIDSFRGTITEIGLRSTKLTDWAGNIKAINNSKVSTVVNLSRLATAFMVNFVIDREEDVQRVEAIIGDNLRGIEQKLPKVIGKIEYRGISSLREDGIELAFLAKVEEANRVQASRDIQRELYLLMVTHGIKVPFKKLYVVSEEGQEGQKATEEEAAKAEALNDLNRKP